MLPHAKTIDKQARRANLLATIAASNPALHRIVVDLATMHDAVDCFTDRLLRGAELLLAGHVYSNNRVKSQSGGQVYTVSFKVVYQCDCEDYVSGRCSHSDFGPVCKHCLAVHLAWCADVKLADEPRRDQNALPVWAGRNGSIEDCLG